MVMTIDIPDKVVERAAALEVPVATFVSNALDQIADAAPTRPTGSIVDLLAMPDGSDLDFDPPRLKGPLYRSVDLP